MSSQSQRKPRRMLPPSATPPGASKPANPAKPAPSKPVPSSQGVAPKHQSQEVPTGETTDKQRGKSDSLGYGQLPPFGLLLARPLLLLISALLGAIIGFVAAGNGGYQSTVVLQFSTPANDSVLVKQTGQTLARTATSAAIVSAAETARGQIGSDLAKRVTAEWTADTKLVNVTVTADSQADAIADANAVAAVVVDTTEANVRAQLDAAQKESNAVLNSQQLDSPDAETARRTQLGSALASRQDAISSQSGDVAVLDSATEATTAGLAKPIGALIGLVAGLLLAGLASLLLGVRGLRANSELGLRQLLPDVELSSPSQAAQIAGQFIESGKDAMAVVTTTGADAEGARLAEDVADFLRAHGKSVAQVGPIGPEDRDQALDILRYAVRGDVNGRIGTDMLIYVVSADSDAASLLEGQSNLQALVIMRRRRTPISAALRVLKSFSRAQPVLVLAR